MTASLLCAHGTSFEGESVGLACAGGQGPNLHLPFRNGARHAKLQVSKSPLTCSRMSRDSRLFQDAGHPTTLEYLHLRQTRHRFLADATDVSARERNEGVSCRAVCGVCCPAVVLRPSRPFFRCYCTAGSMHELTDFLPWPCFSPSKCQDVKMSKWAVTCVRRNLPYQSGRRFLAYFGGRQRGQAVLGLGWEAAHGLGDPQDWNGRKFHEILLHVQRQVTCWLRLHWLC